MIRQLDETLIIRMADGSVADRKLIAGEEFVYFAVYYFRQFFTHGIAPFHWEMYDDLMRLDKREVLYLLWIMFRESSKTSLVKMYAAWCVCFDKKHYINFDSYDKGNAESALFDIAVQFQTNKFILRDFGHLYRESGNWQEKKTLKRISEFITVNDIKCQAFSTQESTRGRLYKEYRPDLFIFDDIENSKTITSLPVIEKIKSHIDETLAGMAPSATAIFLGNLLTEAGVIQYLTDKAKDNPQFKFRQVNVEKDGKPTWPSKYVITDDEAVIKNQGRIPEEFVVSLAGKKRTLGKKVYETEMMNNPEAAGDLVYDRTTIERLLKLVQKPKEEIAGFKLWATYNPAHRYAIGADTAKGVGRDHNASCLIDFSTAIARVIGTYKNNQIAPDIFAYELKRQGQMFGECILAPENNNTGYATITQLKAIYPNDKIFRKQLGLRVNEQPTLDFGWEANSATVPEVVFQLKSAVEDGKLEIWDEELLLEMKFFAQVDLQSVNLKAEQMSRHFDLLRACAIAWKMKDFALVAKPKKTFKQTEYESISAFEQPIAKVDMNDKDWQNKIHDWETGKIHNPLN